jgi:tetratricopeptide (TPR) repeat protein
MSQAELAAPDLSDSLVSLIESGKRNPSRQTIETLARRLGCSVNYLEHGVTEEALAGLRAQVRHARGALKRGCVAEALLGFAAVTASPLFKATTGELQVAARRGLAESLEACGRIDDAIGEWRLAAVAADEIDWDEWATVQVDLFRCLRRRGHLNEAVELVEGALAVLRSVGEHGTDVWLRVAMKLLETYEWRGDQFTARRFAERLVRLAGDCGSVRMRMMVQVRAAALAEADGEHDRAVKLAERALKAIGDFVAVAAPSYGGAAVLDYARLQLLLDRSDRTERARRVLHEYERQLAATEGHDQERAACMTELARAELALDRPGEAVACARRAIGLLSDVHVEALANALAVLGQAHLRLDEHEDARHALTRCATCLEQAGYPRNAARAWFDVAEVLRQSGADSRQECVTYQHALALIGIAPLAATPEAPSRFLDHWGQTAVRTCARGTA